MILKEILAVTVVVVAVVAYSTLITVFTASLTKENLMIEAYERGFATQCLGVRGYHWECEE